MTHSLIVWENNPEGIDLYLVPNEVITPQIRELLDQANGRMINNDDLNAGMDFLNAALAENRDYADDFPDQKDNVAIFAQYKKEIVAGQGLAGVQIDHVYTSGFLL